VTGFDGRQLALSHSFRFGQAIAEEANRWLAIADAPIRLTDSPHVSGRLQPLPGTPEAILCRTNGLLRAGPAPLGGQAWVLVRRSVPAARFGKSLPSRGGR
jgi:hypothetical protein